MEERKESVNVVMLKKKKNLIGNSYLWSDRKGAKAKEYR